MDNAGNEWLGFEACSDVSESGKHYILNDGIMNGMISTMLGSY